MQRKIQSAKQMLSGSCRQDGVSFMTRPPHKFIREEQTHRSTPTTWPFFQATRIYVYVPFMDPQINVPLSCILPKRVLGYVPLHSRWS